MSGLPKKQAVTKVVSIGPQAPTPCATKQAKRAKRRRPIISELAQPLHNVDCMAVAAQLARQSRAAKGAR
jgi:hypothetical protein